MRKPIYFAVRIAVAARDEFEARDALQKLFESEPSIEKVSVAIGAAFAPPMNDANGRDLNQQQHDDIALETYIEAGRMALFALEDARRELVVLRSDVSGEERHDADVSMCGKLNAAAAAISGAVRYHEEGRV